jgi:uncharacterized membrane protein (UPF0127 family)
MKFWLFAFTIVFAAGCGPKESLDKPMQTTPLAAPQPPQSSRTTPLSAYNRATIRVGGKKIEVYVADETAERTEGLMFIRDSELKADDGMLFVFAEERQLSFWMENTLLPLDIAFLNTTGKILNIRQMQPLDRSPQPSEGPAKYALEMHQGWFASHHIRAGDKVDLTNIR